MPPKPPSIKPITMPKIDLKAEMAAMREKAQSSMRLAKGRIKLGSPARLDTDDLDNVEDLDGAQAVADAIAGLDKRKTGNKLAGEELDRWKTQRARVKQIRARQADTAYYTVVVFDTGKQCSAFVAALRDRKFIEPSDDLFIDGRMLAHSMGIKIPEPEYDLAVKFTLASSVTKDMKKVPRGHK